MEQAESMRGIDLAINPGLSNPTDDGAGEFPLPARPSMRMVVPMSSKTTSMIQSQQTEAAYQQIRERIGKDP